MSRSSHQEMMDLLISTISDLKAERRILLDRLAVLTGMGGPLFNLESSPDSSPSTEPEAEATEEEQELDYIKSLRPSQAAAFITRKMKRDHNKIKMGPSVKWIPQPQVDKVMSALDQAELLGKK